MTLVEVLVVLAIIGITAGATVFGLGVATRGVSTASEAQRLASRLRLAADDIMVDDRAVAFVWDEKSYRFEGADGTGGLAPHHLPSGVRLVGAGRAPIGVDGSGVPIDARLESSADSWRVRYDGLTVSANEVPKA
jgi:general secretion pathway protein H